MTVALISSPQLHVYSRKLPQNKLSGNGKNVHIFDQRLSVRDAILLHCVLMDWADSRSQQ